jgi:spermidine synthase
MAAYALTIFTGAFLLFQVQPLIGKYILPWFGGGPGVWTTCMLFFQVLLLGGYAYAHLTARFLRPRWQAAVHLVLLVAAVAMLPIIPSETWKPGANQNPTLQILKLLLATIGLPYFVLSSTGPLLQRWYVTFNPKAMPYRLYSLSNLGSLLALLSFPFLFEPNFTRKIQGTIWGWGLVIFVLVCAYCAIRVWRHATVPDESGVEGNTETSESSQAAPVRPVTGVQKLLWLLLPACASVLLLATTNKLCQDVAVIPFLWVLPLALYLISFIICFDNPRWYVRVPFTVALIAALAGTCWVLYEGTDAPLPRQIVVYSAALFLACMVCHGELYRLKPEPRQLTAFYLMIASGGALGGFFVAVIAPLFFTDYHELHWGLVLCGLLLLAVWISERPVAAGQSLSGADPLPDEPDRSAISKGTWKWMGCVLALLAYVGIDRALEYVGTHQKSLPQAVMIGVRIGLPALFALWAAFWIYRGNFRRFEHWRMVSCILLALGVSALGGALLLQAKAARKERVYASRNFYGVLSVFEYQKAEYGHHFVLQHGGITHGLQFVDERLAKRATTYYGAGSGVDLAMQALPDRARRIGVVGLGTGTMAAFGRPGDYLRIYEINPEVERVAKSRFTYLNHCPGKIDIALGDARLSMEREPSQQFDLLVLDAFSSDAIPVHLLTAEAFELYGRHLHTDGIIAVHISNHYLDLEPVVTNLARHFRYHASLIDYDEETAEEEWWLYSCTWLLLTHNKAVTDSLKIRAASTPLKTNNIPLWTDDFASLFQILQE